MESILKYSETQLEKKLTVEKRNVPGLNSSWHFHPEFELLYISEGNGIRFVGNHISPFSDGEFALVGAYLPHLWRNDPSYYTPESTKTVNAVVAKFTKDFMGNDIYQIPEFISIGKLLHDSKFGILFSKEVSKTLHDDLMNLSDLSLPEQHLGLFKLLHRLSLIDEKHKTNLCSTDLRQSKGGSSERIDKVLRYITDKYNTNITLEEIADVACMTTNSFCRYFKKMTNKSFTQFLNEIRVRNASKLLVKDNNKYISEIAYDVGFNTVANFNKKFKQFTGLTPKEFRDAR